MVDIDINGINVFKKELNGGFNIKLPISNYLNKSILKIKFNLPNAKRPSNGDQRLLAITLVNISVSCDKKNETSHVNEKR